jgi:hypothetical protein
MAEIKKTQEGQVIDYMARDYESILNSMRAIVPDKLPNWKDYKSEADFGNVLLELFAHMGDLLSYYQDRIANESFLGTAQTRQSIIDHLRLIGYCLATAAPASATLKLLVPPDRTETITIEKGCAFATKSQKDKPSIRFEYTGEHPLTIDLSTLTVDPDPVAKGKKYFLSIPVEEGRLIKSEKLGISDGKPNQRFTLAHSSLILRSLGISSGVNKDITVTTQLGDSINTWVLRDSLAYSREGQKDYVIDIDENDLASITFGDGAFGAIPVNGSVIYATYRVGGGLQGNMPAESIQVIVDAPQLALVGAQIKNISAATGGSDRETIEHAVMNAPGIFRSLKRAVTADDYEALALNFKGVGKVRAEAGNWNRVRLFVAPDGGGKVSDILRSNLLAYFEDKRPVTTIIEIEDVDYVKIYISATIGIERYYTIEAIRDKVQQAVQTLLSFNKVDFAQTVYLSKFYEAIEAIDGIRYVTITEFRKQNDTPGSIVLEGKIELSINEIPKIPDEISDKEYLSGLKANITQEVNV